MLNRMHSLFFESRKIPSARVFPWTINIQCTREGIQHPGSRSAVSGQPVCCRRFCTTCVLVRMLKNNSAHLWEVQCSGTMHEKLRIFCRKLQCLKKGMRILTFFLNEPDKRAADFILKKKMKIQIGQYNNREIKQQPCIKQLDNHMTHHSNTQSNKPPLFVYI